ncbi:MAG: 1,4-beta-glucanase [Ruminococcus sp.]|nr:1,4-beta-glucanase [Ruminococcus sp.]
MKTAGKIIAGALAVCITVSGASAVKNADNTYNANAAETVNMEWDAVRIGGGGFVSGIVTGQNVMYARTDVGGAYKYNYDKMEWEQLFAFLNDAERGYLSVDAMAIDPTDDDTVYFLCGCAYFSDAGTRIYKTTDGGKTFTYTDVTDLIQVHGNGYGRQSGESIAVDPDNPDVIYCGGDAAYNSSGLIKSTDGGKTWASVEGYSDLGFFSSSTKWPTWTDRVCKTNDESEYVNQNGIGTLMITGGKVYVGTSATGEGNFAVADVDKDVFTTLSADLPTGSYPSRINLDADGNLLISYIGGLTFVGNGGGVYRYNVSDGTVDDISPTGNSFGGCVSLPDDPDTLVATTCAVWSSQLWYKDAWADDKVSWGDQFYRSTDGGATWESITPGNEKSWGGPLQADYLQDSGYDWIRNKAVHWCGAMVIDPNDADRILITSGNGVFACDNVWDELPVYYFHPDGIEEVVALDLTSVPGGAVYSAIGDYDGFVHTDLNNPSPQHQPNMGSTSAIAYCPQNPDVMIRVAEKQNDTASGFYTLDGGATWTKMNCSYGGKGAITQLDDGSYRFFVSKGDSGNVSYSDDYGATWNDCSGIPTQYGSKPTYMLVEPDKPNVVYAYATYYNSSWGYSKPEPTAEDAQYKLCVSTDYGATFTSTDICMYDQCDSAGRIAYLGEGELILGGGWYGMYHATVSDSGAVTVEKLDSVFYCKTVGYGAPEKEGGVNTLYMYGKPTESDPDGVYRSTDGGASWVCINSDKLYGGTGNGNFLVGDMNEFGTVYMSTVGCGIIYGRIASGEPSTTEPTTATTATTTDNGDILWGDADLDGDVKMSDVIRVMCYASNKEAYPIELQGLKNSDVYQNGDGVTLSDALSIQKKVAQVIDVLPESYME